MERHEERSGVATLGHFARPDVNDRPLTELVSQLSRDTTLLAQQEIALAKQEAADKLGLLKAEVVGVAIGAVLLHAGVMAALAGGILALALVLPPWAAALLSGLALLAAGAVLLLKAKSRLAQLELAPKAVVRNVKEDVQAVKEAAKNDE
jgi:hypothetical protein